jgi:hypothetical protein
VIILTHCLKAQETHEEASHEYEDVGRGDSVEILQEEYCKIINEELNK